MIRLLPATRRDFLRHAFQPKVEPARRYTAFPRTHRYWWASGYDANVPTNWLPDKLEQIGPPAKSELPALRALLDYDGKGATEDGDAIQQVRREAANALLRDLTSGAKEPAAMLEVVIADPTAHKELKGAAEVRLAVFRARGR